MGKAMGRRAGIILSALGLLFTILSFIGFLSMMAAAGARVNVGGGLGGIGVAFLIGLAFAIGLIIIGIVWLIGAILYLASFLTTRYVESKAAGTLQVLGGILHLLFAAITTSRMFSGVSGPIYENLILLLLLVIVPLGVGVLMIRGGVKRIRGWRPAYHPRYPEHGW